MTAVCSDIVVGPVARDITVRLYSSRTPTGGSRLLPNAGFVLCAMSFTQIAAAGLLPTAAVTRTTSQVGLPYAIIFFFKCIFFLHTLFSLVTTKRQLVFVVCFFHILLQHVCNLKLSI